MIPRIDIELDELRLELETNPPPQGRVLLETELGRRLVRLGDHDGALRNLVAARGRFEKLGQVRALAEIDLEVGTTCAHKGEHERALSFLARALDVADEIGDSDLRARASSVLAELALRRGEGARAEELWEVARAHFESYWNGAGLSRCLSGLALVRAERGDHEGAVRLSSRAEEEADATGDPLLIGRAQLARARVLWGGDDLKLAKRFFRRAITVFRKNELRRELAEAYLFYGLFSGDVGHRLGDGTADPAAYWLAKAQELFRELGGLGDLERIREAFRRYGRRATDKVAEVEVLQLLQELKQNRLSVQRSTQQLSDLVMDTVEAFAGLDESTSDTLSDSRAHLLGVERNLSRSLDEMALAEERFLAAVNAVVVERENIRSLIELTRQLSTVPNLAELPDRIAKLGAQLTCADRALVAFNEGSDVEAAGAYGMEPASELQWRDPVRETASPQGSARLLLQDERDHTGARPHSRVDEDRSRKGQMGLGYAMVVPLRHGQRVFGALYVDKEVTGGVFTDRDLDLIAVFAGQAATVIENARIQEELRLAARVKAATLDAVSDAVISIDSGGGITSLNKTARRVLGIELGNPELPELSAVHEIAFLGRHLARGEELDDRIVSLTSGEYLCSSRLIRGDDGGAVGLVATFTELKRATGLAQRIAGSTARYSFGDIIGRSPALKRCLVLGEAAARTDSNLLITGESGTGKEVFAQAVHNGGPRSAGPFVGVNCAAIPRDLLESELFGYESGAFTGARKGGRPGKFELAEEGTILLDEIGDMPLEMQAKLLRVLQERTTQRLGGTKDIPLGCRIIATTNRDLTTEVGRGLFRQDLFFRLRVIHIDLPPLRERPEDIESLTNHFLQVFSARMGKQIAGVEPQVMQVMKSYAWPGNVRELEHVLEGEVNLAPPSARLLTEVPVMLEMTRAIEPFPQPARRAEIAFAPPFYPPPPAASHRSSGSHILPVKTMSESEREVLVAALVAHRGKIPDVARALGVSRGTVYNKMKKFNIDPAQYRN